MHEPPNIAIEQLQDCLEREYGLSVASIEFLPLGLDVNAGVYRVESSDGAMYLLKARTGARYEPAYRVPAYLKEQGIASVVAPLPTTKHALWAGVGTWTLILYPFIVGAATHTPGCCASSARASTSILKAFSTPGTKMRAPR